MRSRDPRPLSVIPDAALWPVEALRGSARLTTHLMQGPECLREGEGKCLTLGVAGQRRFLAQGPAPAPRGGEGGARCVAW